MASPNEAIYLSDCSLKVSIQVYWSAKIGDNHYKWFENVCKGSTHSQKVKSKEIGEKIERKKSNLPQAIFSLSPDISEGIPFSLENQIFVTAW